MSNTTFQATPEKPVPPKPPREVDPSLFNPSAEELVFLKGVVSRDEQEIRRRVLDVQKRAYASYPYPCIRQFHFISLMMSQNAVYQKVLARGKQGNSILMDLGCCMGTDLRKIALDGYASHNLIGCDLRRDFIDIGYELFNDKSTCKISFFTADVFKLAPSLTSSLSTVPLTNVTKLEELKGRLTHIYTGALFHLFDEAAQYALACRLVSMLKVESGAVIFGRHQGSKIAGYLDDHMGRARYGHSPESWKQMWSMAFSEILGEAIAQKVVVDASLVSRPVVAEGQHSHYFMFWSVSVL